MKRFIIVVVLTAFTAVLQASDAKTEAKGVAQDQGASCCSKSKTVSTRLEQTKTEPVAKTSCCGSCCGQTMAKKVVKQPLFSPKGAELARR